MGNRNSLGSIGTIVAVVVAIVGVSIIWAVYSASLSIKGSATAQGAKWSVIFKDLSAATKGNSAGLTSTAKETATPTIKNGTSIENFGISVQTPGDFVSYKFKIRNDGNFPAKISTFTMPKPSCGSATAVCSNLTYTLTYTSNDAAVQTGDVFAAGAEKEVMLKLAYKDSITAANLPSTAVSISNLDITIPFVQY